MTQILLLPSAPEYGVAVLKKDRGSKFGETIAKGREFGYSQSREYIRVAYPCETLLLEPKEFLEEFDFYADFDSPLGRLKKEFPICLDRGGCEGLPKTQIPDHVDPDAILYGNRMKGKENAWSDKVMAIVGDNALTAVYFDLVSPHCWGSSSSYESSSYSWQPFGEWTGN